ncbi:MAG: MmcQ/YjbR family DNA-binding protein [Dehalococcoidia bacterium]
MPKSFADDVRNFALALEGSREEFSFGSDHPVFKAPNGKMFAIASEDAAGTNVSLKLTPEECAEALSLPFVRPAPYLARYHWVMSSITNEAERDMTFTWIRRSYELVVTKPARKR